MEYDRFDADTNRWVKTRPFGATGRRVPQILLEDEQLAAEAAVFDAGDFEETSSAVRTAELAVRTAFLEGRPVIVRARTADHVMDALRRPEVACVFVPPELARFDPVEHLRP